MGFSVHMIISWIVEGTHLNGTFFDGSHSDIAVSLLISAFFRQCLQKCLTQPYLHMLVAITFILKIPQSEKRKSSIHNLLKIHKLLKFVSFSS